MDFLYRSRLLFPLCSKFCDFLLTLRVASFVDERAIFKCGGTSFGMFCDVVEFGFRPQNVGSASVYLAFLLISMIDEVSL